MEGDTLIKLLCDRFAGSAVARVEGSVVAVRASSRPDRTVTVGAGESCVYDELLQPFAVFLTEIPRI